MSTTPATVIDSAVFGDIFSTAPMRSVFSDANRVQKYLDFEAALARAEKRISSHEPDLDWDRATIALQRALIRIHVARKYRGVAVDVR